MNEFLAKIKSAHRIFIISHRNPDADTIGSNIALNLALKSFYKEEIISFCIDSIPEKLNFLLPNKNFIQSTPSQIEKQDLIIFLDCSCINQSAYPFDYSKANSINVDHHESNTNFCKTNLVNPLSSSTCSIIFKLLKNWKIKISPEIATSLLAGIYDDTSSFKNSATNQESLSQAAELMELGGKFPLIVKKLFKNQKIENLKTIGKVLENAQMTSKKILYSKVENLDEKNDLRIGMELLNSVPNCKMALLINENQQQIKASLRTTNQNIDLTKIAKIFSGGGHRQAAGFTIKQTETKV
jgi:phosphoesterase RecJ-like protein